MWPYTQLSEVDYEGKKGGKDEKGGYFCIVSKFENKLESWECSAKGNQLVQFSQERNERKAQWAMEVEHDQVQKK